MSDELSLATLDQKALRCVDCEGWPIDNGAVFVAVFLIREHKPVLGGICELCWLKRLQRRGHFVNATSGPGYQVNLPELDIIPRPKPRPYNYTPPRPSIPRRPR